MTSAARSLIDLHLHRDGRAPLGRIVANARRNGRGWRFIAREVRALSGVAVSHETLRRWFPETTPTSRVAAEGNQAGAGTRAPSAPPVAAALGAPSTT